MHLPGNPLDECRRRTGQQLHRRPGRATDPLCRSRLVSHTRACLLTPCQLRQILDLFASDEHVALEDTWGRPPQDIQAPTAQSTRARARQRRKTKTPASVPETSGPSSPTPHHWLPRRSRQRIPSNACVAPRQDFRTSSLTTSPERCLKPADSNTNDTPIAKSLQQRPGCPAGVLGEERLAVMLVSRVAAPDP